MRKSFLFIFLFFSLFSCNQVKKSTSIGIKESTKTPIKYAKGFEIEYFKDYKIITIKNAWPGTDKVFKYLLINKGMLEPETNSFDAIVTIPVEKMVVTSTTHIPSLEMLGVEETLIGFPSLDYISSKKTRNRIANGFITELGKNENINTEVLLNLEPDLVVGFAVDGNNKSLNAIKKTGVPVVYNGDWTETVPLGKAEWIKFFAAFYNKEKKANQIFSEIETEYNNAIKMALKAINKPTVLSGAMYKDVWHIPQGNSWAAQFIADANANYLWKETQGTGSLSLNLENVLEKAEHATFWIGPSYYTNLTQLQDAHPVYAQFDAFKNKQVYSFTNKIGETGGLLYFELAPNRPDIVLKDMIKILHPELVTNHELYFFDKLK